MMPSIGVDIVFIPRIKLTQALLERVLSPEEIKLYHARHDDKQFFAGRFAAKEAIFKALPPQSISMNQINILPDANGKPIVHFPPFQLEVSISHDGDYAIAIAQWKKEHS